MIDRKVVQRALDEFQNVMLWIDNLAPSFTFDPEWLIDDQKACQAISALEAELAKPEVKVTAIYLDEIEGKIIDEVKE